VKNKKGLLAFLFYRMKTVHIVIVDLGWTMRKKVLPVSRALLGLLVPLDLR